MGNITLRFGSNHTQKSMQLINAIVERISFINGMGTGISLFSDALRKNMKVKNLCQLKETNKY